MSVKKDDLLKCIDVSGCPELMMHGVYQADSDSWPSSFREMVSIKVNGVRLTYDIDRFQLVPSIQVKQVFVPQFKKGDSLVYMPGFMSTPYTLTMGNTYIAMDDSFENRILIEVVFIKNDNGMQIECPVIAFIVLPQTQSPPTSPRKGFTSFPPSANVSLQPRANVGVTEHSNKPCSHVFVEMGFSRSVMVCKHCDLSQQNYNLQKLIVM